ncbi:nuclear transport factor 2 family protein [Allomuricauda sp. d1]|uniref:YybH family protein n=1 Tax=Allomuricauda sp. d1 TaxID=3136725 RepID=UPI0031DB6EEF
MKTNYPLFLLILPTLIFAQYQYEPSAEHPFGLPNPKAPKEIMDFAPMIGECDCKSQSQNQDQTWAGPVDMVWRFKYIMNGTAVQDETLKANGGHSGSIRQFIADSTQWYVHYYSNKGPTTVLPTWEGTKKENGNIILYRAQKAPNGMEGFYRLTFSDMDENGFKWAGEWVNPDETIVYPTWKIDCTKRKPQNGSVNDRQEIVKASQNFSKACMDGNLEGIMDSYTVDAKIFPSGLDILEGEKLKAYWTPRDNGSKIAHHKITSEEIKFFGDYAHDYGYYEGKTERADGSIAEWRGKYVVIWKKEDGDWKMYLDIWNNIKD